MHYINDDSQVKYERIEHKNTTTGEHWFTYEEHGKSAHPYIDEIIKVYPGKVDVNVPDTEYSGAKFDEFVSILAKANDDAKTLWFEQEQKETAI